MCQDLSEYDPFEELIIYVYSNPQQYEVNYPMEEYNWQEFLEADDYLH